MFTIDTSAVYYYFTLFFSKEFFIMSQSFDICLYLLYLLVILIILISICYTSEDPEKQLWIEHLQSTIVFLGLLCIVYVFTMHEYNFGTSYNKYNFVT